MKDRPILMNGEMVRAILDGRKTVTRRVVRLPPDMDGSIVTGVAQRPDGDWTFRHRDIPYDGMTRTAIYMKCPYGQPGDSLVFLCTWAVPKEYDHLKPTQLPDYVRLWSFFSGTPKPEWAGKSRPGRFMPKWMRYQMPKGEVTGVRVERVQDIRREEVAAEGVGSTHWEDEEYWVQKRRFSELWDSINAKRGFGWDKNPWVWVVEFRRIK